MRRLLISGLVLLSLTSCGGDSDTKASVATTSTTTTTPEQGVVAAATEYDGALFSGAGDRVYAMWSTRCRAKQTAQEVADTAAAGPMFATVKSLGRSAVVTGDSAKYSAQYDTPALNKTDQSWVREAGAWKWDGCE